MQASSALSAVYLLARKRSSPDIWINELRMGTSADPFAMSQVSILARWLNGEALLRLCTH